MKKKDIALEIGLTEQRIGQILNKFKNEEILEINLVPDSLQVFDVWNFFGLDTRFGLKGTKDIRISI